MKTIDIALQGGGARGLAHNGAVAALEAAGFRVGHIVGTSAGAIAAMLYGAGYSGAELRDVSCEQNSEGNSRMTEFITHPQPKIMSHRDESIARHFLGFRLPPQFGRLEETVENGLLHGLMHLPGFPNMYNLFEYGGLFSADGFVAWLEEQLEDKQAGRSKATLGELYEATGRFVTCVATDTDGGRELLLNHISAPDLPAVMAVRMSMSIPFVWPEVLWKEEWGRYEGEDVTGHRVVDGGLVSNLDLRALLSKELWARKAMGGKASEADHVIGFALSADRPVTGAPPKPKAHHHAGHPSRLGERISRVFGVMLSGNDRTLTTEYAELVCTLPTGDYGVIEFDMSKERVDALVDSGYRTAAAYLERRFDCAVPKLKG